MRGGLIPTMRFRYSDANKKGTQTSLPFILTPSTMNTTCCNSTAVLLASAAAVFLTHVLCPTPTHSRNLKSACAGFITGGAYILPVAAGSRKAECLIAFKMWK